MLRFAVVLVLCLALTVGAPAVEARPPGGGCTVTSGGAVVCTTSGATISVAPAVSPLVLA